MMDSSSDDEMRRGILVAVDILADLVISEGIKSIARCRCVCWSWCAAISGAAFVRRHHDLSRARPPSSSSMLSILFELNGDGYTTNHMSFYRLPLLLAPPGPTTTVVESDLLSWHTSRLVTITTTSTDHVLICNPATQELVALPRGTHNAEVDYYARRQQIILPMASIGFDRLRNSYVVARYFYHRYGKTTNFDDEDDEATGEPLSSSWDFDIGHEVFTLGSGDGSWEVTDDPPGAIGVEAPICTRRGFYWHSGMPNPRLLRFGLKDRAFEVVARPPTAGEWSPLDGMAVMDDGKLCYLHTATEASSLHVWTANDDDGNGDLKWFILSSHPRAMNRKSSSPSITSPLSSAANLPPHRRCCAHTTGERRCLRHHCLLEILLGIPGQSVFTGVQFTVLETPPPSNDYTAPRLLPARLLHTDCTASTDLPASNLYDYFEQGQSRNIMSTDDIRPAGNGATDASGRDLARDTGAIRFLGSVSTRLLAQNCYVFTGVQFTVLETPPPSNDYTAPRLLPARLLHTDCTASTDLPASNLYDYFEQGQSRNIMSTDDIPPAGNGATDASGRGPLKRHIQLLTLTIGRKLFILSSHPRAMNRKSSSPSITSPLSSAANLPPHRRCCAHTTGESRFLGSVSTRLLAQNCYVFTGVQFTVLETPPPSNDYTAPRLLPARLLHTDCTASTDLPASNLYDYFEQGQSRNIMSTDDIPPAGNGATDASGRGPAPGRYSAASICRIDFPDDELDSHLYALFLPTVIVDGDTLVAVVEEMVYRYNMRDGRMEEVFDIRRQLQYGRPEYKLRPHFGLAHSV
ncbi:hypothetical protein HU200_052687 [Digitaria exilis]|uniref:F-box domain-containing protein n=1 Tax=Digitaria exilis TaxID=1010633 RepID=A0A835ANB9_9POAL|nr:hypothetical protein HU200_052687 [Digitaria exilis]